VYTQCPQCQTLYRVTAELLRAARGQVQCGRCAEVFDALTFLVEDEVIEGPAEAPADLPIELPAEFPAEPTESPAAHDESLEFSLPPEAVGQVFVEAPKIAVPSFAAVAVLTEVAEVHAAEPQAAPVEEIDIPLSVVEEPSNDPVAVAAEPESFDEPPLVEEQESWEVEAVPEPQSDAAEPAGESPKRIVETEDATVIEVIDAGEPANDDRLPGDARRHALAIAEDVEPEDEAHFGDTAVLKERAVHYGWRVGAAALGLMLMVQIVHYDRHELVRRPTLGPVLQRVYSAVGLELSPEWDLKAYEVRQWGAAAAPGSQGTLRVRASVVNTADHPQPLPLLRLTLADLAGARVGVRDFEPREYLPNAAANERMLDAGRRIDAEVVIVDPGKDAVGFEIDVCLRDDEHRVTCANDATPPS
jgi:predicted Zn finger-like uncharacterized protein